MLAKARRFRKEAVYKGAALIGLGCTVLVFCVMLIGGIAMGVIAGIGHRLSA